MSKINFRIFALLLFIIVSWGIAWPINKIGLVYMSPIWYTAMRLIVGTLTMMSIVITINKFTLPRLSDLPLIFIIGLLQIGVYILLANFGLAYLPAGRSSLLAYTTPLWVMPIATFFFRESTGFWRWLGFFLGVGGLVILLSPWQINWADSNVLFGTAMLLLASFCWAISMLCVRYMKWTKSPLELIPWQLLVGTIPIIIFAFIKEPVISVEWSPVLILSLLYTGALVTGLSYWSGIVINKELPTIVVSIGFLVVPVFSVIISAFFMHEVINLTTITAMTLIILGLACVVIEV